MNNKEVLQIAINMHNWFVTHNYQGIDPFQLDEKVFSITHKIPFLKHIREFLKPFHSIIPQKAFVSSPPIYHPKAIGLIILGNINLYKLTDKKSYLEENTELISLLRKLQSPGYKNACWGHPFEWGQYPRYPKNTPFVCVTSPIAHSLLDYYEISSDNETLEICKTVVDYLIEENGYDEIDKNQISLYYSPLDKIYAYNSDIMAASFLYRLYQYRKNDNFIRFADKLINFVVNAQKNDGSWTYADSRGEKEIKMIDNRHTGFILEALSIIYKISRDERIKKSLDNGIDYYLSHLFNKDLPKWSPTQSFPIDIHDVAQSVITLTEIGKLGKAKRIIEFAIEKMSNGKDEFYYKYFRTGKVNKTVFFRWGQAWMYKAISKYLRKIEEVK